MINFLVIKYAMVPNKRFSRNFSNKALKIRPYLSCNCFSQNWGNKSYFKRSQIKGSFLMLLLGLLEVQLTLYGSNFRLRSKKCLHVFFGFLIYQMWGKKKKIFLIGLLVKIWRPRQKMAFWSNQVKNLRYFQPILFAPIFFVKS